MISVILFKMGKHSDFHLSFFQIADAWRDFAVVLGDAVSQLETFVWILNHISRCITWSLFTLKASYLVKWPISTWSFMWWCQFTDWLKFETRTSSLLNFGTANARKLYTRTQIAIKYKHVPSSHVYWNYYHSENTAVFRVLEPPRETAKIAFKKSDSSRNRG